MLRPWSSQTPFVGGLVEHECARCHRAVELPLGRARRYGRWPPIFLADNAGQLCKTCLTNIDRRARKAARIVATLSTLAVGLYIFLPGPIDERARIIGMVGVLIWYILSNVVVRRVMSQWHR